MCLFTSEQKPFIAKTNITVYKELVLDCMYCYATPVRGYRVYPGITVMIPDDTTPGIVKFKGKFSIGKGVIHSYTSPIGSGFDREIFKAIIPRGTEFWVQDDLKEIASKKLYITKEKVSRQDKTDLSWILDYIEPLDVITKDGLITEVEECSKIKDVVGIALGQKIIGLETKKIKFYSKDVFNSDVFDLENGYQNTINLSCTNSPAIQWCLKYRTKGTKRGDWYIPSKNELLMVLTNLLRVNTTLFALKKNIISLDEFIWCSTQDRLLKKGYYYFQSLASLNGDSNYTKYQERLCLPFLNSKPRGEEKGNYLKRLIMRCFQ